MQLVCHHDPGNPDHLICETKLPWTHRVLDLTLGVLVLIILVTGIGVGIFKIKSAQNRPGPFLQSQLTNKQENKVEPEISRQYSGQPAVYLDAEARYYSAEEEQLGRGPWPPLIGQSTSIMVNFKLNFTKSINQSNENTVLVRAKLGPQARWTGFVPIGKGIWYTPEDRTIWWSWQCVPTEQSACGSNLVFQVEIHATAKEIAQKRAAVLQDVIVKSGKNGKTRIFPNLFAQW